LRVKAVLKHPGDSTTAETVHGVHRGHQIRLSKSAASCQEFAGTGKALAISSPGKQPAGCAAL
jgi:hypothetical protein